MLFGKKKISACPRCGGRLFREEPDGSKFCSKCGSLVESGSNLNSMEGSKPAAPQGTMIAARCPVCGSETLCKEGTKSLVCSFCSNSFVPVAPKADAPIAPPNLLKKEEPSNNKEMNGRDIFAFARTNTVEIHSSFGMSACCGSGFFFDNGYVLTNAHVVFANVYEEANVIPAKSVSLNFKGGQRQSAEVVYSDIEGDMALLKTALSCPKVAHIAKKMPETGEAIFAVGNSAGEGMCILEGIVADQLRKVEGLDFMMISANIVGGNSGGPIFSNKGEVVGIVTLGSRQAVAMNYGIPITRIESFLKAAELALHIKFKR